MSKLSILLVILFTTTLSLVRDAEAQQRFRIMFYNVENLFDTSDDSLTADEEFLPGGPRNWNNRKFYDKLNRIYKVIISVGGWELPAVVGLAEVENRFVLERLVYDTPLKNFGYRIIHHDSPDRRGIDVALLYREGFFMPLHEEVIPVRFLSDTASTTRDILYVKGLLGGVEMIHIFVNHWPSRYGGYMATVEKRNHAAAVLKSETDSLLGINPEMAVLIMGDFNDDPVDESLSKILHAHKPEGDPTDSLLYNLMLSHKTDKIPGTLKYRGNWNMFDQIIVSGNLLKAGKILQVNEGMAHIHFEEFLLEPDDAFPGRKPFRTFTGYRYHGGFSDHLPVYTDIRLNGR